ncbi:hypothetical protein ABPG74_019363 [Tetrahymena malaccensis]
MQQNYQVVILAGGQGTELYPLCERFPKALIPVNNKPLIIYQLEKLESNGFSNVLILTSKNTSKIERYIKDYYSGQIKYELVTIPDEKKETFEAIKHVSNKINKDFILIACDSITDLSLDDVIEQHILTGAYLTAVLKEDKVDEENNKVINPSSSADNHDVFLIDESNNKILYVNSFYEIKENGLKIKKSILASNPEASIKTNLFDSHIYICKQQILQVLCKLEKKVSDTISSWKEDLFPFLVRNQQNQNLLELLNEIKKSEHEEEEQQYGLLNQDESNEEKISNIPIIAFITNKNYIKRANNIKDYIQGNFDCIKTDKVMPESFVEIFQNNGIPLISIQESDIKINQSNIADKSQIGSKVQINKSIIGPHCKIGEGVKISNCIIFKEVSIEPGCVLQNCIIGNKATIKQNSKLNDCQIGVNGIVEANSSLSAEVVVQEDN